MIANPTAGWTESESLSLRDALSVVNAWDGDLDTLLEIDSDASSSSDVSQPMKIKKKKTTTGPYTHSGSARKHEIMALRAQARDLQCVIALSQALVGASASSNLQAIKAAALGCEWERLATTQQKRRFLAEMRNAKLKKAMQSQVRNAKSMLQLTKQVGDLEHALYVPPLPSFVNYIGPSIDPEMHLRDASSLVSRAVSLFSSKPFHARGGLQTFHETRFRRDGPREDGADLESQGVWLFPFDIRSVAEAMWIQTIRPTKNYKTSMDIYHNTNAVVSQFMGSSSLGDKVGVIQGQIAARMLPPDLGDGSILIVTNMAARTYKGSQVQGCASAEGWIRIESVPTNDPAHPGPVTVVKRYRRMLMTHPAAAVMSKSERIEWTEAVVASSLQSRFEEEFETSMMGIETMMLSRPPSALRVTEAGVREETC